MDDFEKLFLLGVMNIFIGCHEYWGCIEMREEGQSQAMPPIKLKVKKVVI